MCFKGKPRSGAGPGPDKQSKFIKYHQSHKDAAESKAALEAIRMIVHPGSVWALPLREYRQNGSE